MAAAEPAEAPEWFAKALATPPETHSVPAEGVPITYPARADALAHFRTIPPQETLPYTAAHVAATSVRPAPDGNGWTWKFDPHVFAREQFRAALLTRLDCRVALFRAEHGIMSVQMSEAMYDRLGRVAPVIEIPAAGHHIMLDQPVALIAALRTLLSDWDHSRPAD